MRSGVSLSCMVALLLGCAPDPFDFGGPRSCEIPDQNRWVQGVMDEAYLWREDLPVLDVADFESPAALVAALRVDPDRWSRVSDRTRSDKLFKEGQTLGFGFSTLRDEADRVTIAWVNEGSPAAVAGLRRGDVVASLQGLSTAAIDEARGWGDIYGADQPGTKLDVQVQREDQDLATMTLRKDWYSIETVPIHRVFRVAGQPVGYLMFATFVDPAAPRLDAAFAEFVDAGVQDVIIDLRYNGGGKVAIAHQLLDLLVGDVAAGQPGYKVLYGSGLADQNTTRDLKRREQSLRDPRRVVFITTGRTLSASELVINGARPYVDVRVVGGRTGGKPVGSHQWNFCDSVLSPITFRLVNADDQGEYFDGMTPDCTAADDLTRPLGDPAEGSLAQALRVVSTGACAEASDDDGEDLAPTPGTRHVDRDRTSEWLPGGALLDQSAR